MQSVLGMELENSSHIASGSISSCAVPGADPPPSCGLVQAVLSSLETMLVQMEMGSK